MQKWICFFMAQRVYSRIRHLIWKGVPKFLHRVDPTLKNIGINERVPYSSPLIQFSSWMGGHRDGNPRVTPEVTRDVCCKPVLFKMFEMSMWRCNGELRVQA